MTARTLFVPLLALALAAALLAACGGGNGKERAPGQLSDPRDVPTATPWSEPPEPVIIDPTVLTPPPGETPEPSDDGDGDSGGTPGTCGDTYVVETGDVPFSIASKCGIPADEVSDWVADMLELNNIDDPTTLRVGQELKIPR